MSGAGAVMAVVLFVFFLVGVTVGIIAVIAWSARRAGQEHRQNRRATPPVRTWPYRNEAGTNADEPDQAQW